MDKLDSCSILNDLLVEVHRSLLQYTAEASPWSADVDEELQSRVMQLATEQQASVTELVAFLDSRGHDIDAGVYPHEYTSLHFVSLNYLLRRLGESQQALIGELEAAQDALADDETALELVQGILQRERSILSHISELRPNGASTLV